jgi:hypothetical protein
VALRMLPYLKCDLDWLAYQNYKRNLSKLGDRLTNQLTLKKAKND